MTELKPHAITIKQLKKEKELTWLHLSDFHFGSPGKGRTAVLNRLLQDIKKIEQDTNLSPDIIFITGDIAWSGKTEQYNNEALPFIKKLEEATKVEREQIFLIPGNHDIDRSVGSGLGINSLFDYLLNNGAKNDEKEITDFFCKTTDSIDLERIKNRQKNYINFVEKEFKHCSPLFQPCSYATKVSVPSSLPFEKLWVLGLNTSWLSRESEEERKLILGYNQVVTALNFIEEDKSLEKDFVIALTHHPLFWMTSWDEKLCKKQFETQTDFHLSGHLHEPEFSLETVGPQRYSRIAAGSIFGDRGLQWFNGYYLAQLNFDQGVARAYVREFRPNRNLFLPHPDFNNSNQGFFEWELPAHLHNKNQSDSIPHKETVYNPETKTVTSIKSKPELEVEIPEIQNLITTQLFFLISFLNADNICSSFNSSSSTAAISRQLFDWSISTNNLQKLKDSIRTLRPFFVKKNGNIDLNSFHKFLNPVNKISKDTLLILLLNCPSFIIERLLVTWEVKNNFPRTSSTIPLSEKIRLLVNFSISPAGEGFDSLVDSLRTLIEGQISSQDPIFQDKNALNLLSRNRLINLIMNINDHVIEELLYLTNTDIPNSKILTSRQKAIIAFSNAESPLGVGLCRIEEFLLKRNLIWKTQKNSSNFKSNSHFEGDDLITALLSLGEVQFKTLLILLEVPDQFFINSFTLSDNIFELISFSKSSMGQGLNKISEIFPELLSI